ncbi:MAG TPA: hypothetical protein VFI44_00115, partial [Ornithinibacter sp.]|nr:hypothetical protein [Ornithinibacter sp.]
MTSVRTVVHPGWLEVTGPGVHALVAAADRHADALGAAASGGLLPLLEALTAHGIAGAPDFVVVAPGDSAVRVLVRGSGSVVLADGSRVRSDGRMPWADVDVDLAAAGDEVVVEAPQPQVPRGWRRPARLGRQAAAAAVLGGSPADQPQPEAVDPADARGNIDRLVDLVPEDDPVVRGDIDRLVDLVPEDASAGAEGESTAAEAVAEPEPEPDADASAAPEPDLMPPPPDDASGPPPASPPSRGGLIDAVPSRRGGGATPDPLPPTAAMPVTPPAHAVPDVTADPGSLPRADDDLDRPVVLAVLCPAGHPSPPHAGRC